MEKLISRLRAAYALGNAQRLRSAARALMAYAAKHPMAVAMGEDRDAVLRLAARINAASERDIVNLMQRRVIMRQAHAAAERLIASAAVGARWPECEIPRPYKMG